MQCNVFGLLPRYLECLFEKYITSLGKWLTLGRGREKVGPEGLLVPELGSAQNTKRWGVPQGPSSHKPPMAKAATVRVIQ